MGQVFGKAAELGHPLTGGSFLSSLQALAAPLHGRRHLPAASRLLPWFCTPEKPRGASPGAVPSVRAAATPRPPQTGRTGGVSPSYSQPSSHHGPSLAGNQGSVGEPGAAASGLGSGAGTSGRFGEEQREHNEGTGVHSGEAEGSAEGKVGGLPGGMEGSRGGEAGGEAGLRSGAVGVSSGVPAPSGGALTCFPAAAARDFCRNCRSRGSEGAAETVPRARAMESRARAQWRRHDSISPAGRARAGGGGEALAAPLRLGSGVGDLLASRRLYKPFS